MNTLSLLSLFRPCKGTKILNSLGGRLEFMTSTLFEGAATCTAFRVPPPLAGEESKPVVGSLHLSPQSAIPNREGGRSSDGEINNGEADDGGGEETFRVSGSTLQSVEIEASGPHAGRSRSPTSANFLLRDGDAHFFIKQVPTCQSAWESRHFSSQTGQTAHSSNPSPIEWRLSLLNLAY